MADVPPYPLYNRTYQLYRLSPLHHGNSPLLNEKTLRQHARRLKDQLKGDNVRGVEVAFAGADSALAKLGPLEECNWDMIGDEDDWIDRFQQLQEPDNSQLSSQLTPESARGVEVTLEYETHSYSALLLRDPSSTTSTDGFTSLPLLLLKMPAPLRDAFLNYLKTAFDSHVSLLRLPSTFLISTLESHFRRLTSQDSTQPIRDIIRQLQLQLSFPNSTSLLKHIDVTIAGPDVPGFVSRGKLFKDEKEAPFTAAISQYLQKHLSIDIFNTNVQVSKLTCSGFTLSTDRLKLTAPDALSETSLSDVDAPEVSAGQLAVQDLYSALVREATGTGKFSSENDSIERAASTPSSNESSTAANRKRAVSTTASGNANAKRSKSRGKENPRRGTGDRDVDMQET